MTTSTLRAAVAYLQSMPWTTYATRTGRAMRSAWMAAQLLITAIAVAAAIAYEHREQIRAAAISAIAATYCAGAWCRMQLEASSARLGRWYAALMVPAAVPAAPAPAPVLQLAPAPAAAPRMAALHEMTHRQLMEIAGTRRKLSKRQLMELISAA